MNPTAPRHVVWLVLMLVFWAVYGMTGRDAWQTDEALVFGDVLDWLKGDERLPVSSISPLFTLVAGGLARLLQPWLDLQDGARLATALFTLLALLFTSLTARELFGRGYGSVASLALMGAFGLLLRAHAMLPGTALMAAYAVLLFGIVRARRNPSVAAPAIGLGIALAFLLRGVPDLVAGVAMVLLPLLSREWRGGPYRRALLWALPYLVVPVGLWLGLLSGQGEGAVAAWWGLVSDALMPERHLGALLNLLAWFAWPLWPLALWTLWHEHRRLARMDVLHPLLIAGAILFLLALWPAHTRHGGALPILIPLALLAAHGVGTLKRGAAQAFYWFGALCFLFFLLAFWVYFAAIQWGWVPSIQRHMAELSPGYAFGSVEALPILVAAVVSLLWLAAIPLFPRAKVRPILVWSTGMLLCWVLLMGLFRAWSEESWGYRPMLEKMRAQMPASTCLAAEVDPSMQVMLRYHLGDSLALTPDCRYRLVGDARDREAALAAPAGRLVWEGRRPRLKNEWYRLYDLGP